MDGCNALPDAEAGRGECGDELECARLQPETGHENHRCQRFNEGVAGLKRLILAHPRDCKSDVDVFQVTTDTTRSICLVIVPPITSMIQDDEAMSVFTHSGPGADSRRLRNPRRFSAKNNTCYHLRAVHPHRTNRGFVGRSLCKRCPSEAVMCGIQICGYDGASKHLLP